MEHTLRCNSLTCRKQLNDHAVVTTCSHIFCVDCSNQLQLSGQREGRRPTCPACDAQLPNLDDVVVANLNPTEDYKTSVLSGLDPNVIMECTGRALNFWAYQTAQEIVYQEYLARSLTDKYSALNAQLDKVIHDANSEISKLRDKLSYMQVDQDALKQKNGELIQALREKTRKHLQTQELYDKLKRRAMLGQVQNAARDAVDHTIQASVTARRFDDRLGDQSLCPPPPPLFSAPQISGIRPQESIHANRTQYTAAYTNGGNRNAFASQGGSSQTMHTPSSHRERVPSVNISAVRLGPSNLQPLAHRRSPMQQILRVSPRQPLGPTTGNLSAPPGFAGYGLSAGLKVSNPAGSFASGAIRPMNQSRVAQRPASGFAGHSVSNFNTASEVNMFSSGNNYQ